jgi:hypothetical protein
MTNWITISKHPNLSEDFIRKYKTRLHWYYLLLYQDLSDEFKKEMIYYIKNAEKPTIPIKN